MLVKYFFFVKFKLISLGASDDQKHVTQVVVCLCGRLSYLTGTHLCTTGMGTHISVFMMYVFTFVPVCLSVELPAYLSLSVFAIIIYKSIHHYQYMPCQLAWMVILFHSSQSPTECVSLCVETFPCQYERLVIGMLSSSISLSINISRCNVIFIFSQFLCDEKSDVCFCLWQVVFLS